MAQAKVINDFDTRQVVLDAVIQLSTSHHVASRGLISEFTNIKQTLVDDSLKSLCDSGMIRRIDRGVYAPVLQHPNARQIWTTRLDNEVVKVEIGDDHVLNLTPREATDLGMQLAGYAMRATNMGLEQKLNESIIAAQQNMEAMYKDLTKLMKKQTQAQRKQLDLF